MSVELSVSVPEIVPVGHNRAQQILSEASHLFSQNGYAGTRMSDIAAAIGVTKPIVYRHFESKQVLFEALVRRILSAQIEDVCRRIDEHTGSARDLLSELTRDAHTALKQPGALAPWRIAVGEADRFPDLAAFLRKDFMDPILTSITKLFERAIAAGELRATNPATLARLYASPIASVAMMLATFGEQDPDIEDIDAFLAAHMDGFWRGWSV